MQNLALWSKSRLQNKILNAKTTTTTTKYSTIFKKDTTMSAATPQAKTKTDLKSRSQKEKTLNSQSSQT